MLKGTAIDKYQVEKVCWDMAVRIGDKGWLTLQSSGGWNAQWTLPTGRWALLILTVRNGENANVKYNLSLMQIGRAHV